MINFIFMVKNSVMWKILFFLKIFINTVFKHRMKNVNHPII